MKIPRDVDGRVFADHLIRHWDYCEVRQTGSHIILRTETPEGRRCPFPRINPSASGPWRR